jgi:hypothetical protein
MDILHHYDTTTVPRFAETSRIITGAGISKYNLMMGVILIIFTSIILSSHFLFLISSNKVTNIFL